MALQRGQFKLIECGDGDRIEFWQDIESENEVKRWLLKIGLPHYWDLFKQSGVEDMETVRLLECTDVTREMGVVNEVAAVLITSAIETEKRMNAEYHRAKEIQKLVQNKLQCGTKETATRQSMMQYIQLHIEAMEINLNSTTQIKLDSQHPVTRLRINKFGSELWGVSTKGSVIDMAISVNFRNHRGHKQKLLKQLLHRVVNDENRVFLVDYNYGNLIEATYPILKLRHRASEIEMDISIADRWCFPTNRLVKQCIESCSNSLDISIQSLIMFVKHWSKVRAINDSYRRLLSSFAITLMVIHCAQLLVKQRGLYIRNIADLAARFFEFYAVEFKFDYHAVNIEGERLMKKRTTDPIEIVDPIKSAKHVTDRLNVAMKVGLSQRARIMYEFKRAHTLFKSHDLPILPKLLEPVVIPKRSHDCL